MKILFCDTTFEHARKALKRYLTDDEILYCPKEDIEKIIANVDVAIPLMARLDEDLIEKASKLRLIQQFGVGLEGVDIEAAKRRGIQVANVPAKETGNAISVAEWVVFLMLALARNYWEQLESLRNRKLGVPLGKTLFGKKAGIVGMGSLGCEIATRLGALGMEIWGIKKNPDERQGLPDGIKFLGGPADLKTLLPVVDFLILAVPLTTETRGLISKKELKAMKHTAFLINVSRGSVVNYSALLWALEEKEIAGAGLDVFWEEPIDPDDSIFQYNVIASPHVAAITDHSLDNIAQAVANNLKRLKKGLPLKYLA